MARKAFSAVVAHGAGLAERMAGGRGFTTWEKSVDANTSTGDIFRTSPVEIPLDHADVNA